MTTLELKSIGVIRSCFTEKFGVPRQSGMIREARGVLKLNPEPEFKEALKHLERFSHIWVLFHFHQHGDKPWRPMIRPPRLDAPRTVGVFASRSPHRPNPVGISAVKLDSIDWNAPGGVELHLSGIDLLNDTPVFDIKPYLPYADSIPEANSGWAESTIPEYEVTYSIESLEDLRILEADRPDVKALITEMLKFDPRPTSQRRATPIEDSGNNGLKFGFHLFDFDVQWRILDGRILVAGLPRLTS